MSILFLFIIAVCLLAYAAKVSRRNKEESENRSKNFSIFVSKIMVTISACGQRIMTNLILSSSILQACLIVII